MSEQPVGTPHSTAECGAVTFQGNLAEVFEQAAAWASDPRHRTGEVFAVQLDKLGSYAGAAWDADVLELAVIFSGGPVDKGSGAGG